MKKLLLVVSLVAATLAYAKQFALIEQPVPPLPKHTAKAPRDGLIEAALTSDTGGEELVLKVINSSRRSIRLAAYSLKSPSVVNALLAAKKRGVDIQVVVDEKGNKGKSGSVALSQLASAGIPARTIPSYAIHPDKYLVSDETHVQIGKFKDAEAETESDSRNVMVVWNNPNLANSYLKQWQSKWEQGTEFNATSEWSVESRNTENPRERKQP